MKNPINDPRVVVSSGGGASPEQHFGKLTDGRIFYFRFRSNCAQLHIGVEGEELPVKNPLFDMKEFDKTLQSGYTGPNYPHGFFRLPIGRCDLVYPPGEDWGGYIGFFKTDEDRTLTFTKCLDEIYRMENATSN